MIVSILGLAGTDQDGTIKTSKYSVSDDLTTLIKEGEYINATDALIKCNPQQNFILVGTDISISKQMKILDLDKQTNISIKKYSKTDINEVFNLVYEILKDIENEEIFFDITHSFRDTAIMSVLSTTIHEFVNNKKITIIFAKETENGYEYIQVNEYLDISQMAFLLTSFHQTLNVPILQTKLSLYETMQNFSKQLFSNQINLIINETYPKLKHELQNQKNTSLTHMEHLIEEVLEELKIFENLSKSPSQMFFELSKLMCSKNYLLIASTYLVEALPHYAYAHFKRLELIDEDFDYYTATEVLNFINTGSPQKRLSIPHEYFYCSNATTFKQFSKLVKNVKEIRNNIAHINLQYDEKHIKFKLMKNILLYKKLIKTEKIFDLIVLEEKRDCEPCLKDIRIFERKIQKLLKQFYKKQTFNTQKTITFLFENNIDTQPLNKEIKRLLLHFRKNASDFIQKVYTIFQEKKIDDVSIHNEIETMLKQHQR